MTTRTLIKHLFAGSLFVLLSCLSLQSFSQLSDDEKNASADTAEERFNLEEEAAPESESEPAQMRSVQHQVRYFCQQDGFERRVEIHFPNSPTLLPCSVNYYKDTETPGESQVLWQANNTSGYCEARAAEFVAQLRNQGWDCKTQ